MIDGIRVIKEEKYCICYIDKISDELKQIIKNQLASIWSGFSEVIEMPSTHTYSKTLLSFLDRYNSKSSKTKKGMIGELLSHILIGYYFDELESLSILKNKEERSIKKGFDIIYYHNDNMCLWYTEVKSGENKTGKYNSTKYNTILLNRAKKSICEMFESRRSTLWESALIDAKLVIEQGQRRIDIRNLLNNDLEDIDLNDRKNVILISALYHNLADPIKVKSLNEYQGNTVNENLFYDCFIMSIQKSTYKAIEQFLIDESMSHA